MSVTSHRHPLHILNEGITGFRQGTPYPIPLISTDIDVVIKSGLAIVTTKRCFANHEGVSIEAVMTFPVGFDAIVTGLSAEIDGRHLKAIAQSKNEARQTYESAMVEGKMAVLHEETLRGIHTISVGQLAPGKQVLITLETIISLSNFSGTPFLRIPTTVGQIYGQSPLLPADNLTTSRAIQAWASLTLHVDYGKPEIIGGPAFQNEPVKLPLDRAIEIKLQGGRFGTLDGSAHDGRKVHLTLSPIVSAASGLNLAVLVDRSGSTSSPISIGGRPIWDAMKTGLQAELGKLQDADKIALWQFDDTCEMIGKSTGSNAARLLDNLGKPAGGTRLGPAVETVVNAGHADILVLTDGQTWASEVHSAALKGARINAILLGSGSLDANIGHLAAMTGGQVFYAAGSDVSPAIHSALSAFRLPASPPRGKAQSGRILNLDCTRGGVNISATWDDASCGAPADGIGRYAAALGLSLFPESEATDFAIANNLCSHLTSLILVDQNQPLIASLPEMRKVDLIENLSMTSSLKMSVDIRNNSSEKMSRIVPHPRLTEVNMRYIDALDLYSQLDTSDRSTVPAMPEKSKSALGMYVYFFQNVDWNALSNAFLHGDFSGLTYFEKSYAQDIADHALVRALAAELSIDPMTAALALVATRVADKTRAAERFASRVLGDWKTPSETLARAIELLSES